MFEFIIITASQLSDQIMFSVMSVCLFTGVFQYTFTHVELDLTIYQPITLPPPPPPNISLPWPVWRPVPYCSLKGAPPFYRHLMVANEERKVGNLEERILLEYLLVFIYRNPPHRSFVVNNDWDVIACNSKNPKDVERVRLTKKLQKRWRQQRDEETRRSSRRRMTEVTSSLTTTGTQHTIVISKRHWLKKSASKRCKPWSKNWK